MVALKGNVGMSREGAASLYKLKRFDLIAEDLNDYINKAVNLSTNIHKLNKDRLNQRHIFNESSLMDGIKFGINFDEALTKILENH